MFIWIFVHLRNPINVRQIELLTIWLYSEGGEDRFVVVQHLWCRKICQIVCRVSRKWMESKFLDQDVDVVSLANKGIVIGCFVGRNYNKILMETGKLTDNIRVTKNGLGSGVDRMFQSSDSAFYHFTDRLNPYCSPRSPYRPYNFLNDDFKRSTRYPCLSSLLESRLALRIKHSYEEQARD